MLNKFKNWVENNYFWLIYILFTTIVLSQCNQINKQTKINNKLVKQNNEFVQQLDSLKNIIPTQELLLLQYKKEKYEFLKLSLYDWNTVVRSTKRPDDIIRNYDEEIKIINKKISEKQ